MAKQELTFTIKDIANLIISLDPKFYCAEDNEEQESFCIMDYYMGDGRYFIGRKFRLTIFKDKINIFYFPNLNISIPLKNETEFQEIVGLYFDFKDIAHKHLLNMLSTMIRVKSNYKNPFNSYQEFVDNLMGRENNRNRREPGFIRFAPEQGLAVDEEILNI